MTEPSVPGSGGKAEGVGSSPETLPVEPPMATETAESVPWAEDAEGAGSNPEAPDAEPVPDSSCGALAAI